MPIAVVTVAPVEGSRDLRIRPERGSSDAPAKLAAGLVLTVGLNARVIYQPVGRRLIVQGGA